MIAALTLAPSVRPTALLPTPAATAEAAPRAQVDAVAPPALSAPGPIRRGLARVGDAILDGVHAAGDFLDRHPAAKEGVNLTFALFKGLKAFPKFIYPTISGATAAEKQFILQTLDSLPLKDVNTIKSLIVVPDIPHASGLAIPAQVTNVVKLARDQISIRPEWFREVLIHEAGHTKDFDSAWFGVVGHNSARDPWGQGPFVSNYAKTNHWEDYAEAHAEYHMRQDHLRTVAPEKYAVMQHHEQPSVLDRLIDNQPVRETGKWIGEHMGTQATRTGVQALYWATAGLQVLNGLDRIRTATDLQDPKRHMEGVLDVTAGMLFGSKILALGGLAVQGARRALVSAVDRNEIAPADADAAVRVVTDPIERGVRAVGSRIGLTATFDNARGPAPVDPPHRTLAGSIAVGGGAGALVGGITGPYLGVMAGYAAAGPAGGAVGLVAGALVGCAAGSWAGGRIGGAVGRVLEGHA